MASRLEESTTTAKKMIIGCGIIIVIILLYTFIASLLEQEPPPYNPLPQVAEVAFGQLPNLEFESLQLANSARPEFKIDTTDGKLPSLYPIVEVYKTKTPHQSLTAHEDAVATAQALSFTSSPRAISSTELKWTQGAKALKINKLYRNIEVTTEYAKDPEAKKTHAIIPDYHRYIDLTLNIMKNTKTLPEGYEEANTAITYLALDANNSLKRAKSASEANFIRIDFFKKIDSLTPIIPEYLSKEEQEAMAENYTQYAYYVTNNPNQGQFYIILAGHNGAQDIYELKFSHWDIEEQSTYSLSSIEEAWKKIQSEEGSLRLLEEPNTDPYEPYTPLNVEELLLTNVEIAYYTSSEYLEYIQPIYKFSGIALLEDDRNADFVFYYPAI